MKKATRARVDHDTGIMNGFGICYVLNVCVCCYLSPVVEILIIIFFFLLLLFFLCKSPLTRLKSHCSVRGYKLLLQQKLIDPPLECCEIVICWKAFIGEGVPNGCGSRKKA